MNPVQRLEGDALLAKLRELAHCTKSHKAKACGYVTMGADGTERVMFTAFYEAIALASGVSLNPDRGAGKNGLRYQASVLTTGAVLIGPRYVEQLGLKPGDKVRLAVKPDEIALLRA